MTPNARTTYLGSAYPDLRYAEPHRLNKLDSGNLSFEINNFNFQQTTMSISPVNDADEVAATEGDSNLPLYVPDGNYNSLSDVPEVDDEHDKSSSTVDLERAGYEPVNIAVLSSLSSATSSLDYPTTTPTDPKLCSVCNENVMKYKCSRCYAP